MPLVAGIDSSTQSCKVLLVDADSGEVVDESPAAHPEGTEVHPDAWLDGVAGGGVRAPAARRVPSPSPASSTAWSRWTTRDPSCGRRCCGTTPAPAGAAADLVARARRARRVGDAVGSVPVASFTVTKLRWLAAHEPDDARRVERGRAAPRLADLAARRSGRGARSPTAATPRAPGYWSPHERRYRTDLARAGLRPRARRSRRARPRPRWSGDGPRRRSSSPPAPATTWPPRWASGSRRATWCVSLGTSGTAFAVRDTPSADAHRGGQPVSPTRPDGSCRSCAP